MIAGALVTQKAYRLIPSRLVLGLAKAATGIENDDLGMKGNPVRFYSNTTITRIEKVMFQGDDLYELKSSSPSLKIIHAKRIVHCTNAWSSGLLPHIPVTPVRNQVIATKPSLKLPQRWANGEFSATFNTGYEYCSGRGLDENGMGMIILGGMR